MKRKETPDLAERVMNLPDDLQADLFDYLQQCEEEAAMRVSSECGTVCIIEDENDDLDDLTVDEQEPEAMRSVR